MAAGPESLGVFYGDEITQPVEMFLQAIELKSEKEGWMEATMIQTFLSLIPDQRYDEEEKQIDIPPSAIWKQSVKELGPLMSWPELKKDLLGTFGSKNAYTYQERLTWLHSL